MDSSSRIAAQLCEVDGFLPFGRQCWYLRSAIEGSSWAKGHRAESGRSEPVYFGNFLLISRSGCDDGTGKGSSGTFGEDGSGGELVFTWL